MVTYQMHKLPPVRQVNTEVTASTPGNSAQSLFWVFLKRNIRCASLVTEYVFNGTCELFRDRHDLDMCVATFRAHTPDLEADRHCVVLGEHSTKRGLVSVRRG